MSETFVLRFALAALCFVPAGSATAFAQTAGAPAPAVTGPNGSAPAPVRRYNVYKENERAQKALAAKDYATAIKVFTEVLDSNKLADNWVAPTLFMRGKAFRLSRRNDQAMADYDEALKRDPKLDIAWYERGLILHLQEKYARAMESYSKAIALKPDNSTYYFARCESGLFINKLKDAEADCQKAISLKPGFVLAMATLGRVYEDGGKKARAIEIYRQVLSIDPNNRRARDGLEFLTKN